MTSLIEKAKIFACEAHGTQKYGKFPYSYHLKEVVDILTEHKEASEYLQVAAWLHDVLEDTDKTFEWLICEFGKTISRTVYAVTDEPGKNREERHLRTYPKILAAGRDATALKLADRIANTRNSLKYNHKIYKMYAKEYTNFKFKLKISGELKNMWATLDVLMSKKIEK